MKVNLDEIIEKIQNNSLICLHLRSSYIGSDGARSIAAALESNSSLTSIVLGFNWIGNKGAKSIADALKKNSFLTSAYLGGNCIGDYGIRSIAAALGKNSSLTEVDLWSNQIGDEGARSIAAALEKNNSLTNINLGSNQIGDEGARSISAALEKNNSLTQLYLLQNPISAEELETIRKAITLNREIKDYIDQAKECLNTQEYNKALELYHKAAVLKLNNESIIVEIAKVKQSNQPIIEAQERAAKEAQEKTIREAEEKAAKESKEKLREAEAVKSSKQKTKTIQPEIIEEYSLEIKLTHNLLKVEDAGELNNHGQTIKQVSELIREGNDRLQSGENKAILLLGNTGAGKSTLAHVLSGRKLQAIADDETGELIIDAMQPLGDIVIGHKMSSETKVPNKCRAANHSGK